MKEHLWLCGDSARQSRLLWSFGMVVGLLLAILLLPACGSGVRSTPSYTPLQVYSARAVVTETFAIAQKWRLDAYLVYIDVDIVPVGESSPFPIEFVFQSPSEDKLILTVLCSWDRRCWADSITNQEVGVYQTVPIEPDDFTIDSIEAAKIAQRQGGEEFIKRKDIVMDVQLERFNPRGKGPVLWVASYFDAITREGLYVYIDAKTGEVARDERMNSRLRW